MKSDIVFRVEKHEIEKQKKKKKMDLWAVWSPSESRYGTQMFHRYQSDVRLLSMMEQETRFFIRNPLL